jgi:glycosyltransferase involved in cell wall biosynthesis
MRILLASFVADDAHTGMGKWTHRMASGLGALGHETTTWFAGDFPLAGGSGRLAVLVFPLLLAVRLVRTRRRFDVVAVHEPVGWWCTVLRRLVPGFPPVIAICHNVESKVARVLGDAASRGLARPTRWGWLTRPLLRRWQADGTIRRADAVVCLSEEDRSYIEAAGLRRPGDVAVIPNGGDDPPAPRRDAPAGAPAILWVGGWLDVKGCRLLPAIWSAVRARFPGATLTLAGTGLPPETVFGDFPIADRAGVTVVSKVRERSGMADLYARHGLLLLPSLSEGSPLVVLEAMAAGLPVVAAAVGGVPDLIRDGREGLLFRAMDAGAAADQVARVLADPRLAGDLAAAAESRVRGFTWDRAARALAEVARSVAPATGEVRTP